MARTAVKKKPAAGKKPYASGGAVKRTKRPMGTNKKR